MHKKKYISMIFIKKRYKVTHYNPRWVIGFLKSANSNKIKHCRLVVKPNPLQDQNIKNYS